MNTSIKKLTAILIGVILLAGASNVGVVNGQQDFLTYENPTHGIKINYPGGWEKVEEQSELNIVAFYSPPEDEEDTFSERLSVDVDELLFKMKPEDYIDDVIVNFKEIFTDFMIVESVGITLAGNPAHKLIFTTKGISDLDVKVMFVVTIFEKKAYLILFYAEQQKYDDYLPVAQNMIDSFEMLSKIVVTEGLLTYENPTHGIKINIPADWAIIEPLDDIIMVEFISPLESSSDTFNEHFGIGVENLLLPFTLEEYTDLSINLLKPTIKDFEIVESTATTLGIIPAHKIVYTGKLPDSDIEAKFENVIAIKDKKAYLLWYIAEPRKYSDYLHTVQQMIDSFEIVADVVTEDIRGRYVNSDLGLQIDFPEGWAGNEINIDIATVVTVSPNITKPTSEEDFVFMGVAFMDLLELFSGEFSTPADCDTPPSAAIIKINDMKVIEYGVSECISQGITFDEKTYFLATEEKGIAVSYDVSSENVYESYLEEFEESLKTLKVENTIDLSDPSNAPLFGKILSKEKVMVEGKSYDIEIVSNLDVSEFVFSEENKEISLKVEGKEGSESSTQLYIGKVLEGPYTVTMDGNPMDDVMVVDDKTTGETSVDLTYAEGLHDITIRGTNLVSKVVSELPQIKEVTEQGDISVAMKHKKKLTLVSVKNNGDEEIFGIQLKIDDGKIRYVKARGWDRDRIDQNTVLVQTTDRPIKPGKSLICLLIVDNKTSSFEWKVLDNANNLMTTGDVTPRS